MDENYFDAIVDADAMFEEMYGDVSYNEPPTIDNVSESMNEEQYIDSIEIPSPTPSETVSEEDKECDDLILDKVEETAEKDDKEAEKDSEKDLDDEGSDNDDEDEGCDEEDDGERDNDEEYDMSDTLSDEELNIKKPVIEDAGATIPNETIVETIVPEKEPEVVEPSIKYNDDSNIINEEPFEEPVYEEVKEKEHFDIRATAFRFRKVFAFVVMVLVLIGIPLLFSYAVRGDNDTDNKRNKASNDKPKSTVSTDLNLTESSDYDDIRQSAYDSMSETNESNRFKTLDELTFYIQSNIDSTLSYEKALANQYESGAISSEYFYSELGVYIEYADSLNHLLTINKTTYENEGKMSDYEELSESMDTLILYGDNLNYGTRNNQE